MSRLCMCLVCVFCMRANVVVFVQSHMKQWRNLILPIQPVVCRPCNLPRTHSDSVTADNASRQSRRTSPHLLYHPPPLFWRGLFAPRRRLVCWRRGTSSSRRRRRRRRRHRHGNRSCPMEAQRLSVGPSVAAECCISRLKEVSSVGPEAGWSVNYTAWCSHLSPSSLFVRLSAVTLALD